MAGIHIRNVWATHGGGIYDLPSYVLGIMMKEAFLAGKWTSYRYLTRQSQWRSPWW